VGGPFKGYLLWIGLASLLPSFSLCCSCDWSPYKPYQTLEPYESGKADKQKANKNYKRYYKEEEHNRERK